MTNSSIFAFDRDPESAFTKVRFFKNLEFLLQPNEKLLFGKYDGRGGLTNTASIQCRAFFRNI